MNTLKAIIFFLLLISFSCSSLLWSYNKFNKMKLDFDAEQTKPKPVCLDLDFDARIAAFNSCAPSGYAEACRKAADEIACRKWSQP